MDCVRLSAGRYRAETVVAVALFHRLQCREVFSVRPGEEWEVPHHVNGFWRGAIWYSEFGESPPEYERLDVVDGQAAAPPQLVSGEISDEPLGC